MDDPSGVEARLSALETRMQEVAEEAAAARHLAAARDRDVADLGVKVDASRSVINALGVQTGARFDRLEIKVDRLETRFDHLETRVDRLETKVDTGFAEMHAKFEQVDRGFAEMRAKFDQTAAGMATIVALLTRDEER